MCASARSDVNEGGISTAGISKGSVGCTDFVRDQIKKEKKMNRFNSRTKQLTWLTAALLTAVVASCGGNDPILGIGVIKGSTGPAGITPNILGLAAPFGISATAGLVTAISPSTVNGNVLLDPGAFCNGAPNPVDGAGGIGTCGTIFPPTINGTVISSLFNPGGNLATIKADLNTGFLKLTPTAGPPAAGSLDGATNLPAGTTLGAASGSAPVLNDNLFFPGVYQSLTSIMVTGDLTLDAQGNPDAVFVFQASGPSPTIGTAPGAAGGPGTHTRILLANGAKASNVWWLAASSATIDTFSEFQGNIMGKSVV